MPEWTTALPDWADRIKSGRSIIPSPLFPEEAERGLAILRQLRLVDVPGSPTIEECCAPWVFELAASVFGAYDPETGRRLITEWFVCVPKKNSKSSIAAAIMMTALILNWRQSAEFSVLAPTVEVANNCFAPARDMCSEKADEDLSALMHVQTHVKTITHRESGALLKVLAADENTVGGKKSVGTLVDELHLFGKVASAENMFREALGGLASRPEGFVIWLTTQSDEPPAGVFKQKLDYARDVRDGKIVDPSFVPIIFEHPPEMVANGDCLKLENMAMVNPNLGFSVDRAFLEREYKKAELAGGSTFRGFMAKHANVEIGLNLRNDRWAGADFWEAAGDRLLTKAELLARSEVVVAGIDGGGLDDLLGLVLLGRCAKTGRWLFWAHAWAHRIVLERRKDIAPRLLDFQKDGDLTLVEKPGEDVEQVADLLCEVRDAGLLPDQKAIGVDAAGIGDIVDELLSEERGFAMDHILGVSQGWRLNGAIKTVERKVAGGELIHGAQPLMAWCVGNAKAEAKGNGVAITKQESGKAKIDPLMAGFNAASLMALNPSPHRSFWETAA